MCIFYMGTFESFRITSRTWKCDVYLHSIADGVVLGKHSMCQMIQFSLIFKHKYNVNVKELNTNLINLARLKSLSAAKHRFDSFTKPFGRCVLTLTAMINTAQQIHEERIIHT